MYSVFLLFFYFSLITWVMFIVNLACVSCTVICCCQLHTRSKVTNAIMLCLFYYRIIYI
jgi:hypothetical protein